MLQHYENIQQLSDAFKRFLLSADHVDKNRRIRTINLLPHFERYDWNVFALEDVVGELSPALQFVDMDIATPEGTTPEEMKDAELAAINAVEDIILAYMEKMPHIAGPQLFTLSTAAEYLDISRAQMKKYLHPENRVGGQLLNSNTRIFTRAELDKFNATRRPPGRPALTESD